MQQFKKKKKTRILKWQPITEPTLWRRKQNGPPQPEQSRPLKSVKEKENFDPRNQTNICRASFGKLHTYLGVWRSTATRRKE